MTPRSGLWPSLCLVLSLAVPAGPAAAMNAEQGAAICERAIVDGARRGGIPQQVLHAISLTETGRAHNGKLRPWPWAINREGRGYWFPDRDQALAFARQSLAEGRKSFDVGCFQINYKYHGHNFPSVEAMFEPDVSADYAAQFLGSLYAEKGNWSAAAGAYHSRTPHYAGIYRARFDRILAGLGTLPKVVSVQAEPEPQAEPETPRKSRTRMTRRPLIITVAPRGNADNPLPETEENQERTAGVRMRVHTVPIKSDGLRGAVAAELRF